LALPPLEKPQHAERQRGEQARERECAKEHAGDVRAHAPEQGEMDDGRETQHRDQRRADRDADLAPAQRRAHDQAVVIESRYQGRTSSRGGIQVLRAPPLKLGGQG